MGTEYFVDFETRSELDLTKVGQARYLNHPSTDIVFLTWTVRGGKAKLWLPGAPPPFELKPGDIYTAFNVAFDRGVQNKLGAKYGLSPVPLNQCKDLMALCARLALPQKLEKVCEVLKLKNQKLSKQGKALMSKICSPPFKYTRQEYLLFVEYGLRDTDAIVELADTLPVRTLSVNEQRCWRRTARMNERGIEIDIRMASKIDECVKLYKKKRNSMLHLITEERVKTAGQRVKVLDELKREGVALPDLKLQTVKDTLEEGGISLKAQRILEIRKDVASTSVQKFEKVLTLALNRVLYNMLVYHAASPGRYSSRGLQIHNLIRAKLEDPDALIAEFFDGRIFQKNVVDEAKKLIRSMLKARHGKVYIISDFGSIEYVVCCWICGDTYHLEQFAKNICPYKTLASRLLNKPYEEITKDERQMGKPGVLGGIYGLSWFGYIDYAKGYGIKVRPETAQLTINTLRSDYPLVKNAWYRLQDMVIDAIHFPGTLFRFRLISAKVVVDHRGARWLKINLPSGRPLFYYDPKIGEGRFGPVATHMGVDSKTKQWGRKELSPNRLIENVTQATARDLLIHAENEIEDKTAAYCGGFEQLFSCHDEVVVECNITLLDQVKPVIHNIMTTPPDWAKDLPLTADTFTSKRYKKG